MQLDIFNKRKRHINDNNLAKEGLNLKWRRQKTKSTYFANNQRLWIKFNFDSQKIKDLFGSEGIQQKQPSRGVLRKRSSGNMQQIYRRTPMSKCEFNKLHFGMGVLLHIKFGAWIFSEHIFLRTPLDGCFRCRLLSTLSSCIWNGVNLHVMETKWEAKNFHKNFHGTVFHVGDHFWAIGNWRSRNLKIFFFQYMLYSLKAHAHYFTVFIY